MSVATSPDQAYSLIGSEARSAVDDARKYRDILAGVRALTGLRLDLLATDAVKLGITVLGMDSVGRMAVGMFDLPALNVTSDRLPKCECGWL
jgi:hypothetical protein